MKTSSVLATIGIVGALVLGGISLGRSGEVVVNVPTPNPTPVQVVNKVDVPSVSVAAPRVNVEAPKILGASASPDVYVRNYFNSGLTSGGRVATTSTAATYTTVARDFNGTPTYIDWLPNVNTTISLSSTSTFDYVPKIGDVAKIYIRNASTTAAASITLAAVDANLDLQDNEDSADLAILGLDWMEITLIREDTYRVTALLQEYTEAD